MTKLASMLLVLVLAVTAVACGSDDDNDAVSVEDAESCEQLMDAFIPLVQDVLDAMADLTLEDMQSAEPPESLANLEADLEEFGDKGEDLDCSDEEIEALLMDRVDDLEAEGPVAEMVLEGLKAGEFN